MQPGSSLVCAGFSGTRWDRIGIGGSQSDRQPLLRRISSLGTPNLMLMPCLRRAQVGSFIKPQIRGPCHNRLPTPRARGTALLCSALLSSPARSTCWPPVLYRDIVRCPDLLLSVCHAGRRFPKVSFTVIYRRGLKKIGGFCS